MARLGRPKFQPTGLQRDRVAQLAAAGWGKERIARQIGVDARTLAKHFAAELDRASDERLADALEAMWRCARRGNVTAIKWLAKRCDAARRAGS